MKHLVANLLMLMSIFCFSSLVHADTLMLISGQEVKGDIIERTPFRVTIDVQGMPHTFYLGEIASIDGSEAEVPPPPAAGGESTDQNPGNPAPQQMKANVPHPSDAQNPSKSNVKDQKAPNPKTPLKAETPKAGKPASTAKPFPAASAKLHIGVEGGQGPADKMTDLNKNVLVTADGGVIVVTHNKITKFDKDLNIVRAQDLN